MGDTEIRDLLDEFGVMQADREAFEETWQDIVNHVMPNLAGFFESPPKGQRGDDLINDGGPRYALATFQAGLMGRLMSSTFDWLSVTTPDEDMMDNRETRMWLSKVNQAIFSLISRSNFYPQTYDAFGHAGALGTATVYRYYDQNKQKEVFTVRNPREIYLADDESGDNDTVFRLTMMTYKQMVQAFEDDTLHPEITKMADQPEQRYKENRVLHVVKPNPKWDPRKKDSKSKRYSSWYIDVEHESEIRKGGYGVMPYSTWRIEKEVNEAYGRGPGWRALADIKALYAYAKTDITAAQMLVNPPLEIPEERRGNVKWIPGGRNYYEDAGRRIFQPEQNVDLKAGLEREQHKQQIIERHFMVPFFTMMQQVGKMDRQRTAYEVRQIEQETAILLGPYATGFQVQFMDRIVEGLFYDAMENNMIPPPPAPLLQSLNGRKLEVVYSGPLAMAQKSFFNTEPYRRTLADLQGIMAIDPQGRSTAAVMENFNWDRVIREMANANGLPEEAMLEDKVVQQMRQQKQKMMQQQQKLAAMEQMGKAMPGLNQPIQPGSTAEAMGKMEAQAAAG